jgi:hypothetical protein
VIDRAGDWDGDAVPAARNRPAGGERGDTFPADSPAADNAPSDGARTDAVLTAPEQRSAAHRLYRDRVDHTYDVARIEAGEDAGSQHPQDQQRSQDARPRDASEEGAARDADAEPGASGEAREAEASGAADTRARDADAEPGAGGEAREAEAPGAADTRARDAGSGAREAEAPEAKDTGARGAWAEALPGLRAAWEEHERRFPERSRSAPSSEADGGWVGDGDRRLTPEQNTDASKACEDIRAEGREVIRPAMERVEAADPGRRLAGLEHMLKGEDRLKEKIADEMTAKPELTMSKAVDTVVDAVRFTFTYSPQRYAEGTLADVERVKAEGFELVKLKNLWTDDQYKGINSQWRRPETGLRFEVQFHTPESLEAKELTHGAYERIRSPASPEERREMKAYQRQVNALLVTPPGTADIKDFPEKR